MDYMIYDILLKVVNFFKYLECRQLYAKHLNFILTLIDMRIM